MSNVAVVVEDEPPAGLPLLGLYQGVPLTRRSSAYAGVAPDKITIYRGPARADDRRRPDAPRRRCGGWCCTRSRTTSGSRDERLRELDRY